MKEAIKATVQTSNALAAAGLCDMVWGHAAVRDAEGRGVWTKAAGWGFEEVDAAGLTAARRRPGRA